MWFEASFNMAYQNVPEIFIWFKDKIPLYLYTDLFPVWYRSYTEIWIY